MMEKQKYVIPILASSLSYAVAILLAIAIDQWKWPGLYIYIISFVGVLAASIYAVIIEKKHIEELEKTARTIESRYNQTQNEYIRENRNFCELMINNELQRAATILLPDLKTVRSNIFIPDKTDNKLRIVYSYNMQNAPDLTIRLDRNAGCAGHAYHFGEPKWADLAYLPDPKVQLRNEFKLEDDQIAVTKHLKAVLAVPIRHPINSQLVIGALNLDSTDAVAAVFEE